MNVHLAQQMVTCRRLAHDKVQAEDSVGALRKLDAPEHSQKPAQIYAVWYLWTTVPLARACIGLKTHSGWAALVAINKDHRRQFHLIQRRRIELVDEAWAKQPYHAAEGLRIEEGRDVVHRGIDAARAVSVREMKAAIRRLRDAGYAAVSCGVITGSPMPAAWTVDDILAVHFRMHKAEGLLFQDVLLRAAKACSLKAVSVDEKHLFEGGQTQMELIKEIGRKAGPPWRQDQRAAVLAAMTAFANL